MRVVTVLLKNNANLKISLSKKKHCILENLILRYVKLILISLLYYNLYDKHHKLKRHVMNSLHINLKHRL